MLSLQLPKKAGNRIWKKCGHSPGKIIYSGIQTWWEVAGGRRCMEALNMPDRWYLRSQHDHDGLIVSAKLATSTFFVQCLIGSWRAGCVTYSVAAPALSPWRRLLTMHTLLPSEVCTIIMHAQQLLHACLRYVVSSSFQQQRHKGTRHQLEPNLVKVK